MNTPDYNMRTWDDEPLRAAVEKANGGPLAPIEYVRKKPEDPVARFRIRPVSRLIFQSVGEMASGDHRGVCDDCVWDDHCRDCDCCCEPETP